MDRRVFVYHENAAVGPAILRIWGRSLRRQVSFVEGQADTELGSSIARRLVDEGSAGRLPQAVAEREPQASAFSGRLGGEERGEQVRRQVFRHSGAVVPNSQHRLSVF